MRVIQVIMVRLQRVTISALHNYLGLNTEFIQVSSKKKSVILPTAPSVGKNLGGHKRQLSDQFSLVTSMQEQQTRGDNDIEFPAPPFPANRRFDNKLISDANFD